MGRLIQLSGMRSRLTASLVGLLVSASGCSCGDSDPFACQSDRCFAVTVTGDLAGASALRFDMFTYGEGAGPRESYRDRDSQEFFIPEEGLPSIIYLDVPGNWVPDYAFTFYVQVAAQRVSGGSAVAVGPATAVSVPANETSPVSLALVAADKSTCTDGGMFDGLFDNQTRETDVDCGGDCPPCKDKQPCSAPSDCETVACDGQLCTQPSCADGTKNGDEIDTDCGGSCPAGRCDDGQVCMSAADCRNGVCANLTCVAASCNDGSKNGMESDVDCGGNCGACPDGRACGKPADCASGVCVGGSCLVPTCMDGVKNAAESDVDCGMTCPTKCPLGRRCGDGADCSNGRCIRGICCDGGDIGATCNSAGDCCSGQCVDGSCCARRAGLCGSDADCCGASNRCVLLFCAIPGG